MNPFDDLKLLYDIWKAAGGSDSDNVTTCAHLVDENTYFFWVQIPSSIIIITLMFCVRRLSLWPHILSGRPGILIPMDFLNDRGMRLSYAAVFGLTSSLCLRMILQDYPIQIPGPPFLTVFVKLGTVVVYGFSLYPLLAALTVGTLLSLGLGTLYMWVFFVFYMMRLTDCLKVWDWRFYIEMVFLPAIPELVCSVFLSISFPLRLIRLLRRKKKDEDKRPLQPTISVQKANFSDSYQARYVRELFKKRPKWCEEKSTDETTLTRRVTGKVKSMAYSRVAGFRYSPRILSTYTAGVILLFLVTYEMTSWLIVVVSAILNPLREYIRQSNDTRTLFEVYENVSSYSPDPEVGIVRIVCHWLNTALICLCVSLSLACVIGFCQIALGIRTYREDILKAWRGDFSKFGIDGRKYRNSSLMRAFMYFSGYQVAYIFWGFYIQFVVIATFLAIVSYVIIIPMIYNRATWFLVYVRDYWPVIVVPIGVLILMQILSKYVFLQQKGKVLAIDNRRLLFCMMYFLFFYNVFVGLIGCLLQIAKAIVISVIFFSRLDSSTLPKKFEHMDPGFEAYVGLIHVETAHTHAVVVTFVEMLQEAVGVKNRCGKRHGTESKVSLLPEIEIAADETETRRKQMRTKWFLVYTLINNLPLRATRKHYINAKKERELRRFMDTTIKVVQPTIAVQDDDPVDSSKGEANAKNTTTCNYQTF